MDHVGCPKGQPVEKSMPPERQNRLVRLSEILAPGGPVPISKSQWWEGVRKGRYPQPVKLGPRITAWRASDIERLIEEGVQ